MPAKMAELVSHLLVSISFPPIFFGCPRVIVVNSAITSCHVEFTKSSDGVALRAHFYFYFSAMSAGPSRVIAGPGVCVAAPYSSLCITLGRRVVSRVPGVCAAQPFRRARCGCRVRTASPQYLRHHPYLRERLAGASRPTAGPEHLHRKWLHDKRLVLLGNFPDSTMFTLQTSRAVASEPRAQGVCLAAPHPHGASRRAVASELRAHGVCVAAPHHLGTLRQGCRIRTARSMCLAAHPQRASRRALASEPRAHGVSIAAPHHLGVSLICQRRWLNW